MKPRCVQYLFPMRAMPLFSWRGYRRARLSGLIRASSKLNVLRGNEQQRLAFDEFCCISATPLTLSSAESTTPSFLPSAIPDNGDGQLQTCSARCPIGTTP